MQNNLIDQKIESSNNRLYFINVTVVTIIFIYGLYKFNELYNFVAGPITVTDSSFESDRPLSSSLYQFVTVSGTNTLPTGINIITQRKRRSTTISETVTGEYRFLSVSTKLLLVATPNSQANNLSFTGELKNIPQDLDRSVNNSLHRNYLDTNKLLPKMLVLEDYRSQFYWPLSFLFSLLGLCFYNLFKYRSRRKDPSTHPINKQLIRYGKTADIKSEINQELSSPEVQIINKDIKLTKNWLVSESFFALGLIKINDFVWVFIEKTTHKRNFIKTHTSYQFIARTHDLLEIKLDLTETEARQLLNLIQPRVPWAAFGFTSEFNNLWTKNRDEMIKFIQNKKANFTKKQGS